MARPRTFDETQVLEGAVALFRERGYEGASVPEITERLGICRQSLYNAFGDKHAMFREAQILWNKAQAARGKGETAAYREALLESWDVLVKLFDSIRPYIVSV